MHGLPPESEWPYDVGQFAVRPPQSVWHDAAKLKVSRAFALAGDLNSMRWCLKMGYPFGFGFSVYESFESDEVARTGIVPMPGPDESIVGGHAVVAVGCDDKSRMMIVRNSWGAAWGQAGYCMMPYDYVANPQYASDYWTLRGLNEAPAVA